MFHGEGSGTQAERKALKSFYRYCEQQWHKWWAFEEYPHKSTSRQFVREIKKYTVSHINDTDIIEVENLLNNVGYIPHKNVYIID